MRKFNFFLAIVLVMTMLSLTFVNPAYACSCVPSLPPRQAANEATAVFAGRVTQVEKPFLQRFFRSSEQLQVHFDVSKVWKGGASRDAIVYTPSSSASCGYGFVAGQDYLVYAQQTEDGFSASLCSRTQELSAATEDLAVLGTGNAPSPNSPVKGPNWGLIVPVLVVVGLVVAVTLALIVIRRRTLLSN